MKVNREQIILIVDDKPANLDVIRAYLKEHNFKILVANNGLQALKRLENIKPDLILMDVLMPGLDGIEVCKQIKENPALKDIPLIFMTALADTEHKTQGFSAGAVDFLTKPVQKEELLARVNTHLEIMRYRNFLEEEVCTRTSQLKNEIIERRKKEEEYHILFNNASDAIFIIKKGICDNCNLRALETFNIHKEDVIGFPPFSSLYPIEQPDGTKTADIVEDILNLKYNFTEIELLKKGNIQFSAELYINQLQAKDEDFLQIIVHDITERKKIESMESALIQSSKLAEIGALSAGIVHEIKNPLGGIIQTIQNIELRLLDKENANNLSILEKSGLTFKELDQYLKNRKIDKMISVISESCLLINDIINNMLKFSRKTQLSFSYINICDLLAETLVMAKFNKDFLSISNLSINAQENIPLVYCRKNEIEQVFLNILNNSAQAMVEYKLNNKEYIPELDIKISYNGKSCLIEFKDNGPGIKNEILDDVFELFFTTKSLDKGTGLGLYICRQIIEEKHKGSIKIKNNPNYGITVYISLPIK